MSETEDDATATEGPLADFRAYLLHRRLRPTPQRHLIARALFTSPKHLSVQELLQLVRREDPDIGQATVYRTLGLLMDAGLASERRFGQNQRFFEYCGDSGRHDHLICRRCGFVIEFFSEAIEQEQRRIVDRFGFGEVHGGMRLFGLCAKVRGVPEGDCPMEAGRTG